MRRGHRARRSSSSCSGRCEGSVRSRRSRWSRRGWRRGRGRSRSTSRSTATSTSTSSTGACRWVSCASSSGARASRSGRRSLGSSPSFAFGAARSRRLLGGWLAAFLVVKGFSERATIESGSFWRLLMPAWPAYLLLFASIPLLVPTLARRLGDRVKPATSTSLAPRWIAVAAVVDRADPRHRDRALDPARKDAAEERRAGLREREHPQPGRRRRAARRPARRIVAAAHMDGRRAVARRRLLSRLPPRRAGRRHDLPPLRRASPGTAC